MSRARTRRGMLLVDSPFSTPGSRALEDDDSSITSWYSHCRRSNNIATSSGSTSSVAERGQRPRITIAGEVSNAEGGIASSVFTPSRKRLMLSARTNQSISQSKIRLSFKTASTKGFQASSSKRLLHVAKRLLAADKVLKMRKRGDAKYFGRKGREEFFTFYRALSAERNHFTKEQQNEWVQYVFDGGNSSSDEEEEEEGGTETVRVINRVGSLGDLGEGTTGGQPPCPTTKPQQTPNPVRHGPAFFAADPPAKSSLVTGLDTETITTCATMSYEQGGDAVSAVTETRIDDESTITSTVCGLPPVTNDNDGLEELYEELFGVKRQDILLKSAAAKGAPAAGRGITTPRGWYAFACAEKNSLPTPGSLIRKTMVQTLNLAHLGMGDSNMLSIAKSLRRLPNVTALHVEGNRLTDTSLTEVMRSVEHMRELRSLHLGHNKLNNLSAELLRNYLCSASASITELNLASADVDDVECANFMRAIGSNRRLANLDLSGNLIGSMERRNVLQPDFVTGGEAIAAQLGQSTCCLTRLNLAWNLVRQGSAVALGGALSVNTSLIELDLNYNAVGQDGLAIASALFHNTTLRRLYLKNNALTPMSIYSLALAVRYNRQLEVLDISGNNPGMEGGRQLMGLVLDFSDQLELSFDSQSPAGVHHLDLSKPYDRSVLVEMLHIVATREGITFQSFLHQTDATSSPKEYRLHRRSQALQALERTEFKDAELKQEFNNRLAGQRGGSRRLDAHKLQAALDNLGLDLFPLEDIKNFIHYYDRGYAGGLTYEEFALLAEYLYAVCEDVQPKERFIVDGESTVPWEMPLTGLVTVTLEHRPRVPLDGCCTGIQQVEAFVQATENVGDVFKAMELASGFMTLQLEEASLLYELLCLEGAVKSQAMALVLQRVFVPHTAHLLVDRHLKGFGQDKKHLIYSLGPFYCPVFGAPARRYNLDLSKRVDRLALERLYLMQNRDNILRHKRPHKPDTSSRGDGFNFRNEVFNGHSIALDHAFFQKLPEAGTLQFDYVVHLRPEPCRRWMSNSRFLHYLCQIRLLAPWEMAKAHQQLQAEDRPRNLYDFYQHNVQTAVRLGMQLSKLYNDPFPNQEDERYQKLQALNAIYEEGVKKMGWGSSTGGNLRRKIENEMSRSVKVEDVNHMITNLRRWAKRARIRVHYQEILHEILSMLSNRLLTVNQALILIAFYPEKELDMMERTGGGSSSMAAGYQDDLPGKLRLAITIYPCLIDLFDLDKILFLFTPEQQAEYVYRVGRLNVLNMLRLDGGLQLSLDRREERQMLKIYLQLKTDEPGENLTQESLRYSRMEACVPGWQIAEHWKTEQGIGSRGFLTFDHYSGEGQGFKGCAPNYVLRTALSMFTNIDVPESLVRVLVPATHGMSRQEMDLYFLDYIKHNMAKNGVKFEHGFSPPPL